MTFVSTFASNVLSPKENKIFLLVSTQHIKADKFVNVLGRREIRVTETLTCKSVQFC